jgi:hypothetical protein
LYVFHLFDEDGIAFLEHADGVGKVNAIAYRLRFVLGLYLLFGPDNIASSTPRQDTKIHHRKQHENKLSHRRAVFFVVLRAALFGAVRLGAAGMITCTASRGTVNFLPLFTAPFRATLLKRITTAFVCDATANVFFFVFDLILFNFYNSYMA